MPFATAEGGGTNIKADNGTTPDPASVPNMLVIAGHFKFALVELKPCKSRRSLVGARHACLSI